MNKDISNKGILSYVPSIHKASYIFIAILLFATLILFPISDALGWLSLMATILCVFFFRNPKRITPTDASLIVSPADGILQTIRNAIPPEECGLGTEEMTKLSIFLSVLDVHVNRFPISGKILGIHYHPGKFFSANLDKASTHNERNSLVLEKDGITIAVVQIAGLIARRIICNAKINEQAVAGREFGIIRFGSRVDVYVPINTKISVLTGQRMVGGETVLGKLNETSQNSNTRKPCMEKVT